MIFTLIVPNDINIWTTNIGRINIAYWKKVAETFALNIIVNTLIVLNNATKLSYTFVLRSHTNVKHYIVILLYYLYAPAEMYIFDCSWVRKKIVDIT